MRSQRHHHSRLTFKLIAACLLILGLSGCGNKGPLYRVSEPQTTPGNAEHQHPAPQSQDSQTPDSSNSPENDS